MIYIPARAGQRNHHHPGLIVNACTSGEISQPKHGSELQRREVVLLVEPDEDRRLAWRKLLLERNYDVLETETGQKAIFLIQNYRVDMGLLCSSLPDMSGLQLLKEISLKRPNLPTFMLTENGADEHVLDSICCGVLDPSCQPVDPPTSLRRVAQDVEGDGTDEIRPVSKGTRQELRLDRISCVSEAMRRVVERAREVARSDIRTIVLQGESGVGKDVLARAIHLESCRRMRPFVCIVCSAIPETLLESELFGHEQGAFTDAKTQKPGLFELAADGTVFLDEVTEMSLSVQVKLLSVLESKTFRRVGGTKDIPFPARVISAANSNLSEAVRQKRFREDLFYRLNVVQIFVPPLRERLEDLPFLARQILNVVSQEHRIPSKNLSECASRVLQSHTWPGNVRELKNVLERAIVFSQGDEILARNIELIEDCSFHAGRHRKFDLPSEGVCLSELEQDLVIQALEREHGNQTRAACLLGISRDQLIYRFKKYRLNGFKTRSPGEGPSVA